MILELGTDHLAEGRRDRVLAPIIDDQTLVLDVDASVVDGLRDVG